MLAEAPLIVISRSFRATLCLGYLQVGPTRKDFGRMLALVALPMALMMPQSWPISPVQRAPTLHMMAEGVDFDINAAVTRLDDAVAREDYAAASRIKAEIEAGRGKSGDAMTQLTWGPDIPNWLVSRIEDLGFRYPTPVQAGALELSKRARLGVTVGCW